MSAESDAQREITRIALAGIGPAGFALAGSGAVREHGLIDRPTEDVDLFTSRTEITAFDAAVRRVVDDLQVRGYVVEEKRRARQFARLHVQTPAGVEVDVDLGVDWRERPPVTLDVGPVLSLADATGNKVSALFSRGAARDYLDIDAIRRAGAYSDEDLVAAAAERDPGFDLAMFAHQLDAVQRITPTDVVRYGVSSEQLEQVKARCVQWAQQLRQKF